MYIVKLTNKMYIVKLSAKDENLDVHLLDIELSALDEESAIKKAIDYYYETHWTNTEWRKDEVEFEVEYLKKKLLLLEKDIGSRIKKNIHIPIKDKIIANYEKELREFLGCFDKSLKEFSELPVGDKIDYLFDIGCDLSYFVYLKGSEFEKISI